MKKDRGILFGGRGFQPDGRELTGFPRFLELLDRDLAKFYLSGLPALAAGTLYAFAMWLGLAGRSILIVLAAGLVTGALAGPEITGTMDTILRALRDEPGFWWATYKKAWRKNAGQSCIVGAVIGIILSGQIFCLEQGKYVALVLVGMALLITLFLYVFPQIALVELKTVDLFRNALFLAFAHPKKALGVLVITAAWAGLIWLLFPLSALFLAAGGIWFPALLVLLCLNGLLRETFLERDEEDMP